MYFLEIDATSRAHPGNQPHAVTALLLCEGVQPVVKTERIPSLAPAAGFSGGVTPVEPSGIRERGYHEWGADSHGCSVASFDPRCTQVRAVAPVCSACGVNEVTHVLCERLDSPTSRAFGGRAAPERRHERISQNKVDYMGVNRHKNSGRYEAHIWVPAFGKQVYLGGFNTPTAAAMAHDIVALKARKSTYTTNFPRDMYTRYMDWIETTNLTDVISNIKRQSKSFTRGHSKFRGVSRNAHGRWESRVSCGGKYHIFLGGYKDEEIAARHYDRAMVRLKGRSATTNFPMNEYQDELEDHENNKMAMATPDIHSDHYRSWIKGGYEGKKIQQGF